MFDETKEMRRRKKLTRALLCLFFISVTSTVSFLAQPEEEVLFFLRITVSRRLC